MPIKVPAFYFTGRAGSSHQTITCRAFGAACAPTMRQRRRIGRFAAADARLSRDDYFIDTFQVPAAIMLAH